MCLLAGVSTSSGARLHRRQTNFGGGADSQGGGGESSGPVLTQGSSLVTMGSWVDCLVEIIVLD